MFVSVKTLTSLMDSEIKFVNEAKENHSSVTPSQYQEYLSTMKLSLNSKLIRLGQISCNGKLIAKYDKLIRNLF